MVVLLPCDYAATQMHEYLKVHLILRAYGGMQCLWAPGDMLATSELWRPQLKQSNRNFGLTLPRFVGVRSRYSPHCDNLQTFAPGADMHAIHHLPPTTWL